MLDVFLDPLCHAFFFGEGYVNAPVCQPLLQLQMGQGWLFAPPPQLA